MSENKHTPKPWRVTFANGLPDAVVARNADLGSIPIAKIVLCNDHEDNARLIAAAPDLLDALTQANAFLTGMVREPHPMMAAIRAALAKSGA